MRFECFQFECFYGNAQRIGELNSAIADLYFGGFSATNLYGPVIGDWHDFSGTALTYLELDTVAGLVMKQLGHLPRRGEWVHIAGMQMRVIRADRRRVEMLKITLPDGVVPPGVRESQEEP